MMNKKYLEEGDLSLLAAVPFYKDVQSAVNNPKNLANLIKKNPKIVSAASKMITDGKTNPSKALTTYTDKIDKSLSLAKQEIGDDKFFQSKVQKDYIDVQSYSMYLFYLFKSKLHMNDLAAFLTTIMCTSVGVFWTILSLGRYKFSKQLAEKLADRISRRGLVLQSFLTLSTILFQVGLVLLMQIALTIGGVLWAIKSKSILKILGSLLYMFIAAITALIMISKSGYGAAEGREAISTK